MTDDINPEDLASVDPWYWAYWNRLQLQASKFSLANHEYQITPMQSDARVRVIKKAAQLGFTEIEVLRTLHGQIHGRYPSGVLYLFPTSDDVSDFSKARFAPLIADNYEAVGSHVTSTDSANIKRIGTGMLYLRGARVTQKVEGLKKDASKLRSIPVDKEVFDEVDLMDPDMVMMALERMSHSMIQEEAYVSTPTIPDFGIDRLYQQSDQRVWVIKCLKCRRDCCLELDFPDCVRIDTMGKAYRACAKCGAQLDISTGQWVAQVPTAEIEGYWISQLNSVFIDPGKILSLYEDPPDGNIGEVYNSKLGMAYIAAENRLTVNDVYNCCGPHPMKTKDHGPCAMGVDVGSMLHVVIGKKLENGKKVIVWIGEVPEFVDLFDLAERFNVKEAAVDYLPETRAARDFREAAKFPVYLIIYLDKVRAGERYTEHIGVVDVTRTEICDTTHNQIAKNQYVLPRRNSSIEEYAKQMSNMAKVLEEDKLRGTKIYRYRKLSGPDHYRHATNYFELASKFIPTAIIDPIKHQLRILETQKQQDGYDPLTFGMRGNDGY